MDKLSLHIGSEISLKDFSFSQLIIAVKNLFDTEGVPGLVKVLVILIEQMLIRSRRFECPFCQSNEFHKHSERDRKIKTSIGEVILKLSRLSCSKCGKTFVPFNQLLDLDKYSRKSREFEKLSLETVTNQSFRRSSRNLNDTMGFNTSHTTLHRWFNKTDSVNMDVEKKVDFLIADATGFKKAKRDKFDTNKGSIKVMIGYNKNGEVIPFELGQGLLEGHWEIY